MSVMSTERLIELAVMARRAQRDGHGGVSVEAEDLIALVRQAFKLTGIALEIIDERDEHRQRARRLRDSLTSVLNDGRTHEEQVAARHAARELLERDRDAEHKP